MFKFFRNNIPTLDFRTMQWTPARMACIIRTAVSTSSQCSKSFLIAHQWRSLGVTLTRRNNSSEAVAGSEKVDNGKWDLYVGLVLERRPVITKDKSPLETKYAAFLEQYEVELSKKSDHEIRHEEDGKLIERIKKGEVDQANVSTAEDFEYASIKEREQFEPESRVTEADKKNDKKSLDRSLQTHLLLAVHQKLGKEHKWVVPHMKREDGQTLREVAENAMQTFCPNVQGRILGNAPWGFYKYKYPRDARQDSVGAKVFFYKAQILSGQMELGDKKQEAGLVDDFLWLTRAELPEYFKPEYFNAVSDILIPEY